MTSCGALPNPPRNSCAGKTVQRCDKMYLNRPRHAMHRDRGTQSETEGQDPTPSKKPGVSKDKQTQVRGKTSLRQRPRPHARRGKGNSPQVIETAHQRPQPMRTTQADASAR